MGSGFAATAATNDACVRYFLFFLSPRSRSPNLEKKLSKKKLSLFFFSCLLAHLAHPPTLATLHGQAETSAAVARLGAGRVSVAAVNGPDSVVLSGPLRLVELVAAAALSPPSPAERSPGSSPASLSVSAGEARLTAPPLPLLPPALAAVKTAGKRRIPRPRTDSPLLDRRPPTARSAGGVAWLRG